MILIENDFGKHQWMKEGANIKIGSIRSVQI